MTIFKFLISKTFFKHFGLAIGLSIFLFWFIFLVLRIYTHHGQKLDVPNFTGLTLEEANQAAKKGKVRIEIIDSVFNNNKPKGTVIEQNPLAGSKVKSNRRIFLITNAFSPEKVKMPNLIGVSHRQAKIVLQNHGLNIGKLIHIPDIAINNVLEQHYNGNEITEGESIPKGSQIDLVLGKGLSNERTALPDLMDYSIDDALDKLLRAALNSGAIIYDDSFENSEDSASAKVWRQFPRYRNGKMVQLGSTVDLWVTADTLRFTSDSIQIN